jgi:hypothetical protein
MPVFCYVKIQKMGEQIAVRRDLRMLSLIESYQTLK